MDSFNAKCSALDCARRFVEAVPTDDAAQDGSYLASIDRLIGRRAGDADHRSCSLDNADKLSSASSLESCCGPLDMNDGLDCADTCDPTGRCFSSDSSSFLDSTSCSENSFEISHMSSKSKPPVSLEVDVDIDDGDCPLDDGRRSKSPVVDECDSLERDGCCFAAAAEIELSGLSNGVDGGGREDVDSSLSHSRAIAAAVASQPSSSGHRSLGTVLPRPVATSEPSPMNVQNESGSQQMAETVTSRSESGVSVPYCLPPVAQRVRDRPKLPGGELSDENSELNSLMPQMDFDKLEQDLAKAAREREMKQRKIMSEKVRQRLAMDSGSPLPRYRPSSFKKPLKSNLGARLQSSMNLQVCFVNDTLLSDDDTDGQLENGNDNWCMVSKSVSTPNLKDPTTASSSPAGSVSSAPDSCRNASELRRLAKAQFDLENKDFHAQLERLRWETVLLLYRAKEAAHMQMEIEHQAKQTCSPVEKIIGISIGCHRLTRAHLTKMSVGHLQIILNELHTKIQELNEELMKLLEERDNLHMEQDSVLVDIADLLQRQNSTTAKLSDSLVAIVPSDCSKQPNILYRFFRK